MYKGLCVALLLIGLSSAAFTYKPLWNMSSEMGICSTAAFYNGLAFFGTNGGQLHAVDAKTGASKWKFQGGTMNDSPVVVDSSVIIGDSSGPLRAFDATTGKKQWEFSKSQGFWGSKPVAGKCNGASAVFIGGDTQNVYAISVSNGTALWSKDIGAGADTADAIFYDTENFVIGDQSGVLTSLNANTGKINWKATVRQSGSIYKGTFANGMIYIGGACVSTTGTIKWKIESLSASVGAPAVIGNNVVWPCNDGSVHGSDLDGKLVWSTTLGGTQLDGSAVVFNGLALVGAYHGLFALDPTTGKTTWSIPVKSGYATQLSSPAISGGALYFGTTLGSENYMFAYSISGAGSLNETICDDAACSTNCRTGPVQTGCTKLSNTTSVDRTVNAAAKTLVITQFYSSDSCSTGTFAETEYAEMTCYPIPTGGSFKWSTSS